MIKPTPNQIKKWVEKHFGKDYKVARRGKEIRVNNPFSIDDDYHLWINLRKALVNDFRPNYKSDVAGPFLSFVMKYSQIGFWDSVKEVMGDDVDYKKFDVPIYEDNNEPDVEICLPEGFKKLTYDDTKMSTMIKSYLNRRMVSNGKAYVLGVGYCGLNVVFPYREFTKIVYWQQRSITDKLFLFPEESSKSQFVFGIDTIDPTEPVIVTESIFNSLMFDNSVAIGGSDISEKQKSKIRKIGAKSLIVAFDNDKAGVSGTIKAFDKLDPYFDLFYSYPDDENDWNDVAILNGSDAPIKMLKRNINKLDYKNMIKLKRRQSF